MFIDKAIKKQEKAFGRFNMFMIFLFILFPMLVLVFEIKNIYVYCYLVVLEIAIIFCLVGSKEKMTLKYICKNSFLKIKISIFIKSIKIICDKIVLVHTEKKGDDIEIIVVTTTKVGKRAFKLIGKSVLKTYPTLAVEYEKIQKRNKDTNYYYMIIKNGGFNKFTLLVYIFNHPLVSKFLFAL